ncbi:MAG: cryptochrome/photolyase family protein [Cellvibrionaceae bacterium]
MNLILILGDQLTLSLDVIKHCDKKNDRIVIFEVMEEASYVKHHKKKLVFIFSAMRHFAKELKQKGYQVHYVTLDDKRNTGSLTGEITRAVEAFQPENIHLTFPGEYRVLALFKQWQKQFSIPVIIADDKRFLMHPNDFNRWAEGRKQLRMEYFYREVRKKHQFLMEGNKPVGDKWNYDQENRKALPKELDPPQPTTFSPDKITKDLMLFVENHFDDHFGLLDEFTYAVTRKQALSVLDDFIEQRLVNFGDYQDAMRQGDPWLFHSHISLYLNNGLLLPEEVSERAERAYRNGSVPINAVEGFIRQVIGWREYVRGLYWYKMPDYKRSNYFNNTRKLPSFYWSGNTKMNCLKQCVNDTKTHAYAHHIQRLMVLGNFALLSDIDPDELNNWYLLVYADAYEWVELPNVTGMVLFADGGLLASKPYISSGAYINKMSDYCKNCEYKVTKKEGESACPFNYLYWDFLDRHKEKLSNNPRLGMPYRTLQKMSDEKIATVRHDAELFLKQLDENEKV